MNETHPTPTRQDILKAKLLMASHLKHLAWEAMILLTEPYTPCPGNSASGADHFSAQLACIIEDWQEGRDEWEHESNIRRYVNRIIDGGWASVGY